MHHDDEGERDDDERQGLLKVIWKMWWESKYQWQTLDRAERIGRVGFAQKILFPNCTDLDVN